MNLKTDYEKIANEYLKLFVDKQGYEFMYWIADEVGSIACFVDEYFINFSDIKYDIDNDIEKGLIFKWHDDNVNYNMNRKDKKNINYHSYCRGLRFELLKDDINTDFENITTDDEINTDFKNCINDDIQDELSVKIIKKLNGFLVNFYGGDYNISKVYQQKDEDCSDEDNLEHYVDTFYDIMEYFGDFYSKHRKKNIDIRYENTELIS